MDNSMPGAISVPTCELSTASGRFLLVLSVLWSATTSEACTPVSVDGVSAMDDLDISKMSGVWYELLWIPPYFELPEEVWYDFVEVWDYDSARPDTVTVNAHGRPVNTTECGTFKKQYNKQAGSAAKWVTPRYINASYSFPMDAWILSTDYTSYSLVYGCTVKKPDGTCQLHHGWVWSRDPTELSAAAVEAVNQKLSQLCLTISSFRSMPKITDPCDLPDDNENRGPTSGSSHAIVPRTKHSLGLALLFYILKR